MTPNPHNSPAQLLVSYDQLRARGIPWTRPWVTKLVKLGRFPAPVILAEHTTLWLWADVELWLAECPRGVGAQRGGPRKTRIA